MKRTTGIGGVFFKAKNVTTIKEWYRDNLGFKMDDWGAAFVWNDIDLNNTHACYTSWSPFKDDSDYYAPSTLPYMINYRVSDMTSLINTLRNEGVNVVGGPDEYSYGKFAWIMDPDGRKIELWEPVDSGFGPEGAAWTEKVTGLGGIFLKSDNPAKTKAWYKKHLDIDGRFLLRDASSKKETYATWSVHNNDDPLFAGTDKPYVYSYRVRDLPSLVTELRSKNIQISAGDVTSIIDPEGNKVVLSQH